MSASIRMQARRFLNIWADADSIAQRHPDDPACDEDPYGYPDAGSDADAGPCSPDWQRRPRPVDR